MARKIYVKSSFCIWLLIFFSFFLDFLSSQDKEKTQVPVWASLVDQQDVLYLAEQNQWIVNEQP